MAMSINNNLAAQNIQLILKQNQSQLTKNMTNLGTGKRINSAADDAAGLQIAQRLQMQVSGLKAANANIAKSTDMMTAADAAFKEVGTLLDKMVGLATSAADSSMSDKDRKALDAQYITLRDQAAQILNQTTYGDEKLLVGGKLDSALKFQIGAAADEVLELDYSDLLNAIDTAVEDLVTTKTQKEELVVTIKDVKKVDATTLQLKTANGEDVFELVADGTGPFSDGDTSNPKTYKLSAEAVAAGVKWDAKTGELTVPEKGTNDVEVSISIGDADSASKAITALRTLADQVGELRSGLGATINRLESSSRSNENMTDAMVSSKDGIESTDMASESTQMSSFQVKTQAAVSMLKQAMMADQNVLALLN
ncbi:flagellin [Chromobacterium amazonense]|uniref:flagellin n=1 Tax=Chromobacterium amazonense TaxID=1382803 RepID=UPI0031F5F788